LVRIIVPSYPHPAHQRHGGHGNLEIDDMRAPKMTYLTAATVAYTAIADRVRASLRRWRMSAA
jgi:hypothetical protein